MHVGSCNAFDPSSGELKRRREMELEAVVADLEEHNRFSALSLDAANEKKLFRVCIQMFEAFLVSSEVFRKILMLNVDLPALAHVPRLQTRIPKKTLYVTCIIQNSWG